MAFSSVSTWFGEVFSGSLGSGATCQSQPALCWEVMAQIVQGAAVEGWSCLVAACPVMELS